MTMGGQGAAGGSAGADNPGVDDASAWWAAPPLARVWTRIGDRLEREGLVPHGLVTVSGLDREERRALSDLLGRSILTPRARIDLSRLDARLRARASAGAAAAGLVAAAGAVLGRPLVDRPAVRAERSARLSEPAAVLARWRESHRDAEDHGLDQRLDDWVSALRRDGVLARVEEPGVLVGEALEVLWHQRQHVVARTRRGLGQIPRPTPPPVARTELAARLLGDAHALDDDRRLGAVILRAARLLDSSASAGEPQRTVRDDWESIGILTDRVSSTCLTLGLVTLTAEGSRRLTGTGTVARNDTGARTDAATVRHLTWRDLDSGLRFAPGQTVLVCENPRVVEAAADVRSAGTAAGPGGDVGLVCTSGRPALVTLEVLSRLLDAGADLRYHGDFDWAGVAMAEDLVRRFGVRPWRMGVEDYLALPGRLPLQGQRVDASWDPELSAAMAHRGVAVHEEATLPDLTGSLDELLSPTPAQPHADVQG